MRDIRVELSDEASQRHRLGGRERQDPEPAREGIWLLAGTGGW